jgi:hypothetical protein
VGEWIWKGLESGAEALPGKVPPALADRFGSHESSSQLALGGEEQGSLIDLAFWESLED